MCTSTVIAMCINKASKGKHLYFSYLAISVLRNLVCLSRLSLTYGEKTKTGVQFTKKHRTEMP